MLKSFLWTAAEKFGSQLINLIVQLVLARFLAPEAFGLIGLIQVFIAIAQVMVDGGIGNYIIQKKTLFNTDVSTGFFLNSGVALVTYLALFIFAPAIGRFYEQPIVINLLRFYGVVFVLQAFYIINQSVAIRELEFKKVAFISLSSSVLSAIISILVAFFYRSVYVLVLQQLIFQFTKALLFYIYSTEHVKLNFSKASFLSIYNYSASLLLIGVLNQVFNYAYLIIIGKIFTVADAGFYNMSRMIIGYGATTISMVIERVSFPVLSRLFHNSFESYKNKLYAFSHLSILLLTTFSFLTSIYSTEIISLFLGEKWVGASTIMFYLGLSFLLYPITITSYTIFKTNGKSTIFLYASLISKLLVVVAIALTYNSMLETLLLSQVIVNFTNSIIFIVLACKTLNMSLVEYFINHKKLFLLILIWASIQWLFKQYINWFFFIEILASSLITILINYLFKIYDFRKLISEISNIQTSESFTN